MIDPTVNDIFNENIDLANFYEKSWRDVLHLASPPVHHALCALCNLRTVKARVLKFHIWILHCLSFTFHEKISDPYLFILTELYPILEFCPFEKILWAGYL